MHSDVGLSLLVRFVISLRTLDDDRSVGDQDRAATNLGVCCDLGIYNFIRKTIFGYDRSF